MTVPTGCLSPINFADASFRMIADESVWKSLPVLL